MTSTGSMDYRLRFRDLLAERSRKNRSFSLRAFARLVGLSPSHLSRVLAGKARLSIDTAAQICEALEVPAALGREILDLVALEGATSEKARARILSRMPVAKGSPLTRSLELDAFHVVASWEHFAILNLARTKGFKPDPRLIARRLGLGVPAVKAALERLVSLDLLVLEKDGRYRIVDDVNVQTNESITSTAVRSHHAELLEKARQALDEQGTDEREFESLMLPFRLNQMANAKKEIRAFVDAFHRRFESQPGDEVYNLGIQFIRVSQSVPGAKT